MHDMLDARAARRLPQTCLTWQPLPQLVPTTTMSRSTCLLQDRAAVSWLCRTSCSAAAQGVSPASRRTSRWCWLTAAACSWTLPSS